MTKTPSKTQILLARLVVVLMVALIVLGLAWNGFSHEDRVRLWQNIIDRPGGPMTFRFILQPAMATLAALFDGIKDARTGRSPYFWTILSNPAERAVRLHEGLISTSRIVLLGLGMDVIYQVIELKAFFPGEAVIVALLLAFIPYLLLRGLIARIGRWWLADVPANQVR
jgi:hypothetical protein